VNTVQLIAALVAALGGLGGLATSLRAKAQNRLDGAGARLREAEADSIAVDTARDLIAEVREEMNRRVSALDREVARLTGKLDGALEQRDRFRAEAENLHRENRELRDRIASLEKRVSDVTEALINERERRKALEAASRPGDEPEPA
jgi:chromosome segregation ATPase